MIAGSLSLYGDHMTRQANTHPYTLQIPNQLWQAWTQALQAYNAALPINETPSSRARIAIRLIGDWTLAQLKAKTEKEKQDETVDT
jgi:hypothetical protein